MEQKDIKELIKVIDKSSLTEFRIKDGEFSLSIKKGYDAPAVLQHATQSALPQMQPVQVTPTHSKPEQPTKTEPEEKPNTKQEASNAVEFKSPMIGTFYRKPAPDKDVFVKVGDKVSKGDILCVIEAMKLFNEIECEMDGTIVKVLVDDAAPVEYDQALFLIDPA